MCPRKYVGMREVLRLQAYVMYKKGFLPNLGTWLDQPQKFFDAMDIIEKVVTEIQEAESKRKK